MMITPRSQTPFLVFLLLLPLYLFAQSEIESEKQAEVLTFWFGKLDGEDSYPQDKVKSWFMKNPAFDREIQEKFEPLVIQAAGGKLDGWKATPRGRLALVVLLDQFPRNIYRNSLKAFSLDPISIKIVLEGIKNGDDLKLYPIERSVFYLPLMHSESKEMQNISVIKYGELVKNAPKSLQNNFLGNYDYALRHQKIVEQFGRFPHRNQVLGRKSTPEEIQFLKEPGSSF
jgi:uncharacterized protein (DUF924 family)